MANCSVCGKPLEAPIVKCSSCGAELHRGCAKKTLGKTYCKSCFKKGKKESRYERMAQRATWR